MWGWEKYFLLFLKWDLDCSYLLNEWIIVLFPIYCKKKSINFFAKKWMRSSHVSSLNSYRSFPHLKLLPNAEEIERKGVCLSNSDAFIVMDVVVLWQGSLFFPNMFTSLNGHFICLKHLPCVHISMIFMPKENCSTKIDWVHIFWIFQIIFLSL